MRILFVDQYASLGGGQQCLIDSLHGVLARGWVPTVALPGEGPLTTRIRSMGIEVASIRSGPYTSGAKSASDFVRYVRDTTSQRRTLSEMIAALSPDLIYANGPRILSACVDAARCRVPVLFHAHNYLGQSYAVRVARAGIRRGNVTVVACCNHVAQPLLPAIAPGRLHIIPNGVPEMPYNPPPKPGMRIGMIGRMAPEKGHLVFVEAARALARALPQAEFVVAGCPPSPDDAYASKVKRAAKGLPFEYIPWQDRIDAVLAAFNLLVVPSIEEGAPRVVLEAFSAGVPVLASEVGGIPEIVEDERTGFLSPPGKAAELARRIASLIGDTDRLHTVAANGRRAWESLYSVALYCDRITELLATLARQEIPKSGRATRKPRTE